MTAYSLQEWTAKAQQLSFPHNAFIAGAFRPALSGKTLDTVNPATGEVLAKLAACDTADVDYAVSEARNVFERGDWRLQAPRRAKAFCWHLRICLNSTAMNLR